MQRIEPDLPAWADSETLVFTLLATDGPLSRADLVARSGLSKATVLWVVERLLARGVIEVGGTEGRRRPGPRPLLYQATAKSEFGIGVEIHRRGIDVDLQGVGNAPLYRRLYQVQSQPTLDDVTTAVATACSQVGLSAHDAAVVAVSVGGGVDPGTGRLLSWNLPDWHQDLVHGLTDAVRAPVELENETNLWAMAEREIGACQEHPDFVLMTLNEDTGIGGALVFDGAIRHGRMGLSGEFGYLPLGYLPLAGDAVGGPDGGRLPESDLRSLLEADAINALAATSGRAGSSAVETIRDAVAETAPGEPDAFVDALADRVAIALRAVMVVVDPGCFVLAGDIGLAGGAQLAGRVRDRLRPVFGSLGVEPPEVLVSTVDHEPIHRGLMSLVQRRLRDRVIGGSDAPTITAPSTTEPSTTEPSTTGPSTTEAAG